MNRKLHNTVTALAATTGLLVLSLMAANPAVAPAPLPAPAEHFAATDIAFEDVAVDHVEKARHAAEAAKRIELRAARLEERLARAKEPGDALGEIVGFAAEAATIAAIATALDEAAVASTTLPAPAAAPTPRKRGASRQSVAMPFFSFAPRG